MTEHPGAPLILCDVDGVLNQIEFTAASRKHLAYRHGWRKGPAWRDGKEYKLFVNPDCGKLLRDLATATGAELAWATTLADAASLYVAPLAGLPKLPTVDPAPFGLKAAYAVPFTAGRPFVWFDDSEHELAAADLLTAGAGQPHLGIRVNPAFGLTAADTRRALGWLTGLGSTGEIVAAPEFRDVCVPCGHDRCPWDKPAGGLPAEPPEPDDLGRAGPFSREFTALYGEYQADGSPGDWAGWLDQRKALAGGTGEAPDNRA